MNRKKHFLRIVSLCCVLALVLAAAPAAAGADDSPTISLGSTSAYHGDSLNLYISGTGLLDLSAVRCEIYYDTRYFTYQGGSSNCDMQFSVNTSAPGVILLDGMVAGNEGGISGDATLYSLTFSVKQDAPTRAISFQLALGEAYNTLLEPLSLKSHGGTVTVLSKTTVQQIYMYGFTTTSNVLRKDQQTSITFCLGDNYNLGTGKFVVNYDSDLLEYVDGSFVSSLGNLTGDITVHDGQVSFACLSTQPIPSSNLLRITLKAKQDCDAMTNVTCQPSQLFTTGGTALSGNICSVDLTLQKDPSLVTQPKLWLKEQDTGSELVYELWLEGSSGAASGDFTIRYDADLLAYTKGTASNLSPEGVTLYINDNDPGIFKLSMLCAGGISQDTPLMRFSLTPDPDGVSSTITLAAAAVEDVDSRPVTLACQNCPVETRTWLEQTGPGSFTANRFSQGVIDLSEAVDDSAFTLCLPSSLILDTKNGFTVRFPLADLYFDAAAASELETLGQNVTLHLAHGGALSLTDAQGMPVELTTGSMKLTVKSLAAGADAVGYLFLLKDKILISSTAGAALEQTLTKLDGYEVVSLSAAQSEDGFSVIGHNHTEQIIFCVAAYSSKGQMLSLHVLTDDVLTLQADSVKLFVLDKQWLPIVQDLKLDQN